MSLRDRFEKAGAIEPRRRPPTPGKAKPPAQKPPKPARTARKQGGQPPAPAPEGPPPEAAKAPRAAKSDPLGELKARAQRSLYQRMGSRLYDSDMSREQLHSYVVTELEQAMADEAVPLTEAERHQIVAAVKDDVIGYGPIESMLNDPTITEIMVNGTDAIYIEQLGKIVLSDVSFLSEDHLRRVIERICSEVGRRIDESTPMVDARLLDGSRVNAIIPPIAAKGSALTIRKFPEKPMTMQDLISKGSLTQETADFLEGCVLGRLNIVVSGGTGTGKTTMLNLLSDYIPDDERIVTIEDSMELRLQQRHVISLEARQANAEGRGAVAIRDLVKNSLRMRPDRIVIGECRGGEALDMLQAMNTGHEGSLTTAHANTPRDMMSRLETMVLMGELDLPIRAIRDQIASAVDLIVQLTRLKDGRRAVTRISEVAGMEGDIITLSDLFDFDWSAGFTEEGGYGGVLMPTGVRPQFDERLAAHGIVFSPEVFGASPDSGSGDWAPR